VCEPRGAPVRPDRFVAVLNCLGVTTWAPRGIEPWLWSGTAHRLWLAPNQHLKLTKAPPEDIGSNAVACSVGPRYRKGICSAAMSCSFSCSGRRRLGSLNAFRYTPGRETNNG
jgi:hypothetical protein